MARTRTHGARSWTLLAGAFLLGGLTVALAGEAVTARVQAGLAAIADLVGAAAADEEPERPPTPVTLAPVDVDTAREIYSAVGEVRARNRVEVTPPAEGIVEAVRVADGASVEAGDVIVMLRRAEEERALEAAEAAVAEAEEALGRSLQLLDDGFSTEAEVQQDRSVFAAARAEAAMAEQALADRAVRAPFAGRVGLLLVDPGAFVGMGDAVATLATTEDVLLRFAVPPAIADALAPGQSLEISLDGPRDANRQAVIETISPLVDEATRTVTVEAAIEGPAGLRPGTFATADVVWQLREDAHFVPAEAVVLDGRLAFVYVAGPDGTAERREVRLGERREGVVEVREGVEPEDMVLVEGQQDVEDGDPIAEATVAGAAAPEAAR